MITELVTWRKLKHKEQTRNKTIPATKPLKYCQTISPSYSDGDRGAKTEALVKVLKGMERPPEPLPPPNSSSTLEDLRFIL